MTDINHPYLGDRDLYEKDNPPPIEIFAFHFTRDFREESEEFGWRFHAIKGFREEITHNYHINPQFKYKQEHFFQFAYGNFVIVLQEPQFIRYAKQLAKTMLLVDPESIVVIDKKSGRVSGARPSEERLEDKIRFDMLDFFGMEMGDVVVR